MRRSYGEVRESKREEIRTCLKPKAAIKITSPTRRAVVKRSGGMSEKQGMKRE
jgi:hypothetical protein